jgi:hypothetical protein
VITAQVFRLESWGSWLSPVECIAWGEPEAFRVEDLAESTTPSPDGLLLWGREFDLLPTGTMANAHLMLHGILGVPARGIGATQMEIGATQMEITDDRVLMVGTRGTNTDDLIPYQDLLLQLFSDLPISQHQKP